MSDITYGITIEYLQAGNLSLPSGFNALQSSAKSLETSLGGMGQTFARGFGSAVDAVGSTIIDAVSTASLAAGGALATGLALATKAGIEFNATIENATLGLATVQDMQLGTGIEQGMRNASAAIESARKDAQRLPGEFKDLVQIMQSAAPAALQRGIDLPRLERMSANAMAAASAMGVSYLVAGRQLAATLEGRATSAMAFPMRLGLDREAIKKMTGPQRADAIEAALAKANPSVALYAQSWAGLTSTAHDSARQLSGIMAAPVFGSMKGELGRALEWFGNNEDKVNAIAANLGVYIDRAFHFGLDAARKWIPIAETFGRRLYDSISGAFAIAEPYLRRFAGMAEHFARDPNAPHMIGSAALALGGAKAASVGMDLGIDALKTFGPLLSSAGFSAAELGAAGLVAAPAVAALGLGAAGALDILTDSSNSLHDFAVQQLGEMKTEAISAGKSMGELAQTARPLVDLLGADLLLSVNLTVGAFDLVVSSMTSFYEGMKKLIELTGANLTTLNPTEYKYDPGIGYNPMPKIIGALESGEMGAKKPPVHNTIIHGGVHNVINVDGGEDPQRVAEKTFDIIKDKLARPTTTRSPMSDALGY